MDEYTQQNDIQIVNKTRRVDSDSPFINGFNWFKRNALPIGLLVNQIYPVADKLSTVINLLGVKIVGYNYYLLPALYIVNTVCKERNKKQRKLINEISILTAVDSVLFLTAVKENNGVVINKLTASITAQTGHLIFSIAFVFIAVEIFVKAMHLYAKSYRGVTTDSTIEFVKDTIADIKDDGVINDSVVAVNDYSTPHGEIPLLIGKTVDTKKPIYTDLTELPHFIIAGATKSGKSVCVNALLAQFLQYSPEDLQLILVDPKRVEFAPYSEIPHLLTNDIIYDIDKAIEVLEALTDEMNRRTQLLQDARVRNVQQYNKKGKHLPYIVFVIDEMANFMLAKDKKKVDIFHDLLANLTAMSRATGIHFILCTQRPDANVVTGIIKCNVTSTICFKVKNKLNSNIILDEDGGEALRGKGHMIFKSFYQEPDTFELQGEYISNEELDDIIDESISKFKPATKLGSKPKLTLVKQDQDENQSSFNMGEIITKENSNQEDNKELKEIYEWAMKRDSFSANAIRQEFGFGTPKATRIYNDIQKMLQQTDVSF